MKKRLRFLSLLLVAVLCIGMLAGCKGTGKDNGKVESSKTESKPGNLAGVENEQTMVVKGDVDKSKILTTLIDCDASPAFNGNPFDDVAGANWSIQPFLFDYLAFFDAGGRSALFREVEG